MTDLVEKQSVPNHRWITLGIIILMIILRFTITGLSLFGGGGPEWVTVVYEVGTYLLVAILLIRERNNLLNYHINLLAIWFIILFKPLETLYLSLLAELHPLMTFPLAIPKISSLMIWIIALGLLVFFRKRLFKMSEARHQDHKWLLFGGLAGLVMALVLSYPMSFQIENVNPDPRYLLRSTLGMGFITIFYQIGYAAVSEEPVFRGFLWGYLKKSGWKDIWILFFQAGLFILAHLYYINTMPFSFWVIVPVISLVLGLLVWRSRTIATSMAAHGVVNGLGYAMGYIVAFLRL